MLVLHELARMQINSANVVLDGRSFEVVWSRSSFGSLITPWDIPPFRRGQRSSDDYTTL